MRNRELADVEEREFFEVEAKRVNDFKSLLDQDERVIRHLVMKKDKAEIEDCPPPPEFRASMIGEDDDDWDDDEEEWYEDEDWSDDEEGVIYVEDDDDDKRGARSILIVKTK